MLITSYLRRLYPAFQVDFQRPVVISKVATQGARQYLKHNFVLNYTISYSTDKKKWIFYKGDSDTVRKASDYLYNKCICSKCYTKTLNALLYRSELAFPSV